MLNLLALAGSSYENTARGILYVVYEMLWKIIYYVLTLIDMIANLFYKVAGINVNDGVVENKNMFDQILNQNVISSWYGIFMLISISLIIIFTVIAIIRAVASREEKMSLGPVLKNIGLACILMIALGPVVLLVISVVSNLGIAVAGIGGNESISIADILFNNSGNLLAVYNEKFSASAASFRDLGNDFLYDVIYNPSTAEGATTLSFHWYIIVLGGGFILYNLACIVIEIVKIIFNIILLYVGSPFTISKMVLDDGKSFRAWQNKFIYEFVLLLAQMGTFVIFVALVNVLNNIDFEGLTEVAPDTGLDGGILEPEGGEVEEVVTSEYSLLNGLGRTLITMAAASVTRSSATMIANLLNAKETNTDSLLESMLAKMSRGPSTKTRTITKTTTSTKKETVFVEASRTGRSFVDGPSSESGKRGNTTLNNNVTQNFNVNNKFSANNTFNNRSVKEGVNKGNYSQGKVAPATIYINTTKVVEPAVKGSNWKFMDSAVNKTATTVVKEYTKASTNLTNIINNGDSSKLKDTLKEYTNAYNKEAAILSENYKKFEARASATMRNEVSEQTKQELRNITNAYRKAQVDYNKTATKLKQYDGERISTADALKMKEQADKQRERLMHASNKAAQFYENQKKGE